jgi:hypothetical protein
MKRFFEDPNSFAALLAFSPLYLGFFVLIGSPLKLIYFSHQENSVFQQKLNTVLECRKSVEITQMDEICGPIPQRGGSK